MTNTPETTPNHPAYVLGILSLLMAFGAISTDVYIPAMPTIAASLNASPGAIEYTISGYLVGFSLGQLFWGPISDRRGRRGPVAIGLLFFILGSVGCALSTSAAMMIAWRIVQAFGACAGVVLARAMVRDLYAGDRAAQMLSTLITVMAIAPLIGPIVGAKILELSSWQTIFWMLVGVGVFTLAALKALPETLPPDRVNRKPLSHALAQYAELIKHPRFMIYAAIGAFYYAGTFAYIAGTPFAYINYYEVSPQHYGLLFAVGIAGIMITNMMNVRLVPIFGINRLLTIGTTLAVIAGVTTAIDAETSFGGLWGLVLPLFVFIGATGLVIANSIAGALNTFPEHAGAASALVGTVQYGAGVLGSGLVGMFADGTPGPMGAVIAATSMCCAACVWLLKLFPPQPPE